MDKELRILIVEDMPTDIELFERELRNAGITFQSRSVDTRESLLRELEGFSPDIILSDYTLPSFDGMSALKIVREKSPNIPFIFVSGTLGEEKAIETLKAGATDYVLKERLSRLVPAVHRALREAEERRELERVEYTLRENLVRISEQAALLDIAADAITVRDMDQNIVFWSKGAERIYGWKEHEVIGGKVTELLYSEESPESGEVHEVLTERGQYKGEMQHVTKDGREIIVESRLTLVTDDEGKPESILSVSTDITDRKLFEAQLLRAQRMESIGTLAGGIAHDLNNVFQPMLMSLEILRMRSPDKQSMNLIHTIETSIQRGSNLVKQVLSFAKGQECERTDLHIKHIISEITDMIKETFPKTIEFRSDLPAELLTISGDFTQLNQVLMNLCVNARDAMPYGGSLSITAENFHIDENFVKMNIDAKVGQYIAITISDTGSGIPPKVLDKIFELFFTTKEPGKGTGLGLSTSFRIVKNHGGFIDVWSEAGKGTKFTIYLPALESAEAVSTGVNSSAGLPLGQGEMILVVDDEPSIREITQYTLETYGYRVMTADDGAQAVSKYSQKREEIKAIIMDISMPVMDGHTSIKSIREIDPQVKVIVMSGLKNISGNREIGPGETDVFLPKPYTAETLLMTLREVINSDTGFRRDNIYADNPAKTVHYEPN